MSPRGVLATLFAALFLSTLAYYTWQNARPVSEEELLRRIDASRPTWANYPEDIKAQIGARSCAEWAGTPVSAERSANVVTVRFAVSGKWAEYSRGLPILLRDPFGSVHLPRASSRKGDLVSYEFVLTGLDENSSLPWVEIQYPHTTRRLLFSSDATWKA